MLDSLRDRIARELGQTGQGVLSAVIDGRPAALPVRYRQSGLQLECLLPRWSDLVTLMDGAPLLFTVDLEPGGRWIQVRGRAGRVEAPDWGALLTEAPVAVHPADLYEVLRVHTVRVDLFDGGTGWGSRETLDL